MKPTIRPLHPLDIPRLACNLRDCDKEELKAATGKSTLVTLRESVALSEVVWVAEANGEPFIIFGYAKANYENSDKDVGVPWMVATDAIYEHKLFVARQSIKWRDIFHERFPILTNFAYIKNVDTLNWLRWLGFEFASPAPLGPNNKSFIQFMRVQDV